MKASIAIDTIEALPDGNIMIVACDELSAKQLIKRNPRCQIVRDEHCSGDERIAVIYGGADINWLGLIKRA
jgi:hypothetical protein